jgi:hypothetical protein
VAALHCEAEAQGIGNGVAGSGREEVAFGRLESLATGFEREADIELGGESPVANLPGVSGTHEDLPGSGSKLED